MKHKCRRLSARALLVFAVLAPVVRLHAGVLRLKEISPEDFARYGATATAVAYEKLPEGWLIDDWHRLGVKVYQTLVPGW